MLEPHHNVTSLSPRDHAAKVRDQESKELHELGLITLEPKTTALAQQRKSGAYDAFTAVAWRCEEAHWSIRWLLRRTVARWIKEIWADY